MSRIDELIAEHCPNGVVFQPLGDVVSYEQPGKYLVESTSYDASHLTPVLTAGQTFILGYTNETTRIYPASPGNPVVIYDDFTTAFKWVDFPFKAKSSAMKMLSPKAPDVADLKYIYYAMQTIRYAPQDHARQWIGTYSKFVVPVPPLEVQREIVRVLDTFTELEAELRAELEARQRQYDHYRNSLLTLGDREDIEWAPMGEVLNMRAGRFIKAADLSATQNTSHCFPCFGGNGIRGYASHPSHEGEYVLIGRQGALCGNVKLARGSFYATEHAVVVTPSPHLDVRWVFHVLEHMNLNQHATKSAQPGLAVRTLEQLLFPVPPLAEQNRIASVLDSFDALVNNLSAELAARRRQYEFYRDRLLSFEEAMS